MALLELRNVKKIYDMGRDIQVEALKGVSFSIEEGSYTAIMGHSGSGKSTLLQIMGCLDRATDGDIIINGTAVKNMNDFQLARFRNKTIGFVFQSFNLIGNLSALENIELPMIYAGVPRAERRKKSMELLKTVGLEEPAERGHHRPNQLSGGQQQRVAIARALANDPAVILADEPTGNLAVNQWRRILDIFKKLNESGKTIIIVTHDPLVGEEATRTIILEDGSIVNDERIR
ncbi:MAG: ABC transporter ATP-binding protein [Thermotogae bacterium]|jgi:putative ABC transport system ATP-binding protein|nr:ABC transporter ATP-binding protein [Thermotogota bacterium]